MLDQINEWLVGYTTLEMADVISSGLEAVFELGDQGAIDELTMLWQQAGDMLYSDLLDQLRGLVSGSLSNKLAEIGVILSSEIQLPLLVQSAEAMLWVNLTEEHDVVVNLLSDTSDATYRIAMLFAHANTTQPERWDNLILDVSDEAIESILELHTNTSEIADEKVELDLSKIMTFDLKYPETLMRRALDTGWAPKMHDLKTLTEAYSKELIKYCPNDAKAAAINLAGLTILSDVDDKQIVLSAKVIAEEIFPDVDFLRAVRMQLPQILGGVKIYG